MEYAGFTRFDVAAVVSLALIAVLVGVVAFDQKGDYCYKDSLAYTLGISIEALGVVFARGSLAGVLIAVVSAIGFACLARFITKDVLPGKRIRGHFVKGGIFVACFSLQVFVLMIAFVGWLDFAA